MKELFWSFLLLLWCIATMGQAFAVDSKDVWQALKKDNQCGSKRLQDIQFYLTKKQIQSGDAYVIGGQLNNGRILGKSDKAFGGRSPKKDLMLIHRIVKNQRLVGYNIKLSLCEKSEFHRGLKIVGPESKLTQFRIPGEMILGGNYNCPLGHINSGHITFKSSRFGIESLPISFEGVCSGTAGQQFARNYRP